MAKDKTALEMNFGEFKAWATSRILFGIGEGLALQDLVHTIVDHAARNKVFGGGKPAKAKK